MEKNTDKKVIVDAEKCTDCLNCQLICSFTFGQAFNPSAARIVVNRTNGHKEVYFTEECTDCGLCAKYCLYGTLTLREEGS